MTDKPKENLAVRVASDPMLIKKIFIRLTDPQYHIPKEIEEEIKKLGDVRSTDKGVLVSKVTTPEDYQTQLKLISGIQHLLDRIHEINTTLFSIQHQYKELYNAALRIVMLTYFNELNELKDGVRKVVVAVALQPIQEGLDKLQYLIDITESSQKYLTAANFNIKDATAIIRDYLSLYKFGSNVRVPKDV